MSIRRNFGNPKQSCYSRYQIKIYELYGYHAIR